MDKYCKMCKNTCGVLLRMTLYNETLQHLLLRSRSCHGKTEMLFEDICSSNNLINTSHINNRGKKDKDVTMSCSSIQVSPKPFSMTGTNLFF